jgi:hypothetical protein
MITAIMDCAAVYTEKVLRLLNIYINVTPELPYAAHAFGMLVGHDYVFLAHECAPQYIRVVHSAISHHRRLKVSELEKVSSMFRAILEKGTPDVQDIVLAILYTDVAFEKLIANVPFGSLLRDPIREHTGLIILYRYHERMRITVELLQLLVSCSKTSKATAYVLLQLCEKEQIALSLARMVDQWIGENLPTLRMTMKILLMIARFPSPHRQMIASSEGFPLLLARIASNGDPKILPRIGRIVALFSLGPSFVRECSAFFEKYYDLVLAQYRESPALVQDAMNLTEMLAGVAFSPHYLKLLPLLAIAFQTAGWGHIAVGLALTLSAHPDARPGLIENGLVPLVKAYAADPQLTHYVVRFLHNMESWS